jgi:fumarate reductase subunit D
MEDENLNQHQPVGSSSTPPMTPAPEQRFEQPYSRMEAGADDNTVVEDRIFAALSYISLLFVVPLILKNENEDIHFHAKQGLVLFGAELAVWFVLFLLDTFLSILFPSTELLLVKLLGAVAWLGFTALSLAGIYMVARGKRWNMPFISRIAARIKV